MLEFEALFDLGIRVRLLILRGEGGNIRDLRDVYVRTCFREEKKFECSDGGGGGGSIPFCFPSLFADQRNRQLRIFQMLEN